MDICYPPDTDWSCRFTDAEVAEIRALEETDPRRRLLVKAESFAWSLLASLTAYSIGQCPITVRPCALGCTPSGYYQTGAVRGGNAAALPQATIGMFNPYITGGRWVNGCGCRTDCSCTSLSEVVLPGPVGRIVSIYQDGELVPSTAYRVDDGNRLVRLDGESWPACQDMALSDTAGFSVTYYRGAAPNVMTRAAAGALAADFYAGCEGGQCRLPANLVAANRAGESYEFETTDFADGKTGIREVDAVIQIYNPYGLKTRPTVVSPDSLSTPRMRTA
jgi:hypothetical protein